MLFALLFLLYVLFYIFYEPLSFSNKYFSPRSQHTATCWCGSLLLHILIETGSTGNETDANEQLADAYPAQKLSKRGLIE